MSMRYLDLEVAKHYIALRVRNVMQRFATSQLPMQAENTELPQLPTGHRYDCVCIKYGCGQVHKVSHVTWQHHLATASSEEERRCIHAAHLLGDRMATLPPLANSSLSPDRNHSVPPSVRRIEALRGLAKRAREDCDPNEYVGHHKHACARWPTGTSHIEVNSRIQGDANETAGPLLSQTVRTGDAEMDNYPSAQRGVVDPINDNEDRFSTHPSPPHSPPPDDEPRFSPPPSPHRSSLPDGPDANPPSPNRTYRTPPNISYQRRAQPHIDIQDLSQRVILPKLQETMSFILALASAKIR
ncbi:hypothetical protein EDD15DRAFT_2368765 [Pisolithus albus]|nr:hypothetical protein EDD15DRAFT_2368765 [Pisolithus albus]